MIWKQSRHFQLQVNLITDGADLPSRAAAPPSVNVLMNIPSFSSPASAPTPIPMMLRPRPSLPTRYHSSTVTDRTSPIYRTTPQAVTLKQCTCSERFSTSLLLYRCSIRATSIYHRPSATSAERRCAGYTWSVTTWSCPSGAEEAALAASRASYSVQGRAFDVYGTRQSLSRVYKWIRSTSQQQPSTSTSSLCQQPRLHCSTDKKIWTPSLLCCRSDSTEQSAWVCQISRDCF